MTSSDTGHIFDTSLCNMIYCLQTILWLCSLQKVLLSVRAIGIERSTTDVRLSLEFGKRLS